MSRSATTNAGEMGSTASESSGVGTMMVGARTKTGLSAKGGSESCLVKIFTESASTCPKPNGPTRLGPYRSCHNASRRRSTQISPAARLSTTNRTTAMMTKGKRFHLMEHLWMVQSELVQGCRKLAELYPQPATVRRASQPHHEGGRPATWPP